MTGSRRVGKWFCRGVTAAAERPLLNRPEAMVFKALDAAAVANNPGWQVMAQVSLGEFLATRDKDAYLAINSKRVDFALMDKTARLRHAIEYQGTGHYQNDAAARDAVKKEGLRKAGIGYHEVVAGHTTPAELKRLMEKLVPGHNWYRVPGIGVPGIEIPEFPRY